MRLCWLPMRPVQKSERPHESEATRLSPESMEAFALPVLNAIQNPVIMLNADGYVVFANWEAEAFFGASARICRAMSSRR